MNVVLQPQGNLDLKVAAMLQQKVARLAWDKYNRWLIDLAQVNSVGHSGLMALVAAHELARKSGHRLSLCNLRESVLYVLEITELDKMLEILHEDDETFLLAEKIVF